MNSKWHCLEHTIQALITIYNGLYSRSLYDLLNHFKTSAWETFKLCFSNPIEIILTIYFHKLVLIPKRPIPILAFCKKKNKAKRVQLLISLCHDYDK